MHKPFADLIAQRIARRAEETRARLERYYGRPAADTNTGALDGNDQADRQPPTATPSAGTDENHGD